MQKMDNGHITSHHRVTEFHKVVRIMRLIDKKKKKMDIWKTLKIKQRVRIEKVPHFQVI
jgi:hypothetical protein